MNLIIDIGNTSIKLAVFDAQNKLKFFERTDPSKIFQDLESFRSTMP